METEDQTSENPREVKGFLFGFPKRIQAKRKEILGGFIVPNNGHVGTYDWITNHENVLTSRLGVNPNVSLVGRN